MDAETLRKVAELVRRRAAMAVVSPEDRERLQDRRDGLERLGAQRVLEQLAIDLDVMAEHRGDQQRAQREQHGRSVAWRARQAILAGQDVTLDLVGMDRGLLVTDVYLRASQCLVVDQDDTEMAVAYQDVLDMSAIGTAG